ncbi:MAG: NAD-dependent epimerase/dehydratase family protein [Clostridia bacterium]|nr:NAD-dependent epimerase/dehydratase family protein [Clostridia bacterium]
MKALFIGGTGIISTSVSRCAVENGWDLTLLNRGNRPDDVPGARQLILDISDEQAAAKALENQHFDVVVDFIAFDSAQIERDIRLFTGKTDQYMFISSASVYQKPLPSPVISEATSLSNPYWEYARKKIACEETLMKAFRNNGFPVTIIRPSHTFANCSIPVPVHGKNGAWQVLKRMMNGKRIIVPGDGNTLWAVMSSADFARAFVGLMGNIHAIGQAVQIASEELLTWNQILQTEAKALGVEFKPCYVPSSLLASCKSYDLRGALFGDKANTVIFDCSKLHSLVPGFTAQRRFDQAAPESIAYFLSHPEIQRDDPDFDAFCDRIVEIMENAEAQMDGL